MELTKVRLGVSEANRLNKLLVGRQIRSAKGRRGRVHKITKGGIQVRYDDSREIHTYSLYDTIINENLWLTDPASQDELRSAILKATEQDAPPKPAAPTPKEITPQDIDVATNVKVVCFFRGVAQEQYLYHMALLSLDGFDTSIEQGFEGKHALFALRESAKYLKCSANTLLSTKEELILTILKDCQPNKGWTWTEANEDVTPEEYLHRVISCKHAESGRSISLHAIYELDGDKRCMAMHCNLLAPSKGDDALSLTDFGTSGLDAGTVKLFEEIHQRLFSKGKGAQATAKPVASTKPAAVVKPAVNPSPTPKPIRKSKPIRVNEFLVRRSYGSHRKNGHSLEPVRATVSILPRFGGDVYPTEFDAYWCPKCRKYYMEERTFERLKRLGYICCKVIEEKDLDAGKSKGSGIYGNLAQESILHMYGYTVSQQVGLSAEERRDIISFVVENRIQSTQDIAHLLEWLIASHEKNPRMDTAVGKWEDDLDYVRHYRKPTRRVRVDAIYARG